MPTGDCYRFYAEHESQVEQLCEKFGDYEPLHGFERAHLRSWVGQFSAQHRDLALRFARCITYYSTSGLSRLMPALYQEIRRQLKTEKATMHTAFFVPFGRIGESGGDIARRFRNVNKLHRLRDQFVEAIALPERVFKTSGSVVFFLDDFVGTGEQVVDGWPSNPASSLSGIPMYLAVVAALEEGVSKIEAETPLRVISVHSLGLNCQMMESACRSLSAGEKSTMKRYCEEAGNLPLGFGDRGLMVSFAYGTPNNSVSVIRGSEKQSPWKGLLPRWEDLG